MDEIIKISGIEYQAKYSADKITLKRYNEKYKMRVILHFPTGNQVEGKKIEGEIIQILSDLYIEKHAKLAIQKLQT